MAQRRMFNSQIVSSDAFLEMPISSQGLYFHLGMSADDDGFVTPRKVIRMLGAGEDDLKVLIAKGFVIPFNSGVIVITHWKMNNTIKNDRYSPSIYKEERQLVSCNSNVYQLVPFRIQDGSKVDPQEGSKVGNKKDQNLHKAEPETNPDQRAAHFEKGRQLLRKRHAIT